MLNNKTIKILITIPSHCSLRGVIEDPLSYSRRFIPSENDNEVEEIIFREVEKQTDLKKTPEEIVEVGSEIKKSIIDEVL